MEIRKYALNCFLLLIPVIVWNVLLVDYLPMGYSPEVFDKNIPNWVIYSEGILRLLVFMLPVFMVFSLKTRLNKIGFTTYIIGLILYCASWLTMILSPESSWSQSLVGFMAPACTTFVFFVGIGLVGNRAFFKIPYISLIYICLSMLFVVSHSAHAYLVYMRL